MSISEENQVKSVNFGHQQVGAYSEAEDRYKVEGGLGLGTKIVKRRGGKAS